MLQNKAQHILACDKFGFRKRMPNSDVLIFCNGEYIFVHSIAKLLLLFHVNTQADSRRLKYVFIQCVDCAVALELVQKEQSCVCLSTTDGQDHSANAEEELKDRTVMNMGE